MKIIALVTDGFGGHGGIALYCRHMLNSICKINCVTSVVAIPRILPVFEENIPHKINYHNNAANNKFQYIRHVIRLALENPRPKLVICGHINLLIFSVFIKKITGSKLILVLYGIEAWTKPKKPLVRWCLNQVDQVTTISRITRDRFTSWSNYPGNGISIIPNGIELSDYGAAAKPRYLIDKYELAGKKTILTVGRLDALEKSKGFDQVIRTLPDLLLRNPDIRYLVVGSGNDAMRLRALAKELKVSHAVIFTGQIDDREKSDHYRLADAYVMPSRDEGFGYVYLEAMACGLPVVGSSTDGSRDALLDGKLGELVDPSNLDKIRNAIKTALNKPKSVPQELALFSIERFQKNYQDLIKSVLN